MTGEGEVTLTAELIHAGASASGGWNKPQLEAIGIGWGQVRRSGWIGRNAGRVVSVAAYRQFLDLKGVTQGTRHGKVIDAVGRATRAVERLIELGAAEELVELLAAIRDCGPVRGYYTSTPSEEEATAPAAARGC